MSSEDSGWEKSSSPSVEVTWGTLRVIDDLLHADDRYVKSSTSPRSFTSTFPSSSILIAAAKRINHFMYGEWINLIFVIAKVITSINFDHMPFKN